MKLASIVGARPQFIKLAPLSAALRAGGGRADTVEEVILHTGQHYDERMSATFFAELAIPEPDYNLEIGSGPHGMQTGRMLEALEEVLVKERPDGVVVFGDTNSTLAGALAAAKLHIPTAHVEAGLRSFNRSMPEEVNRVVTDHLSDRLYCPTETARGHLASEGITRGVEVVGDVMYDVLLAVRPGLARRAAQVLAQVGVTPGGYVLLTVHRAANTDDPAAMRRIADAMGAVGLPVIFPVHPRTRKLMQEYGLTWAPSVHLIEPAGYGDMLALQEAASCVATDSGGVQKEAFFLGTPCVTLREETEWTETVASGWNVLVGNESEAIVAAVHRPRPAPPAHNPFGTGDAALRIAASLRAWLGGGTAVRDEGADPDRGVA
jgi:UDP-N-acetylglucosamine 2-epimerase